MYKWYCAFMTPSLSRCTFTVKVVSYKAKVVVPFKADFKIGFSANFETSSESW